MCMYLYDSVHALANVCVCVCVCVCAHACVCVCVGVCVWGGVCAKMTISHVVFVLCVFKLKSEC